MTCQQSNANDDEDSEQNRSPSRLGPLWQGMQRQVRSVHDQVYVGVVKSVRVELDETDEGGEVVYEERTRKACPVSIRIPVPKPLSEEISFGLVFQESSAPGQNFSDTAV